MRDMGISFYKSVAGIQDQNPRFAGVASASCFTRFC